MDIHCRYCGEPWDHDELHDMESWTGHDMSYRQAAKRFKELGCLSLIHISEPTRPY